MNPTAIYMCSDLIYCFPLHECREKAQLTEHLSNLEDESAAVKVSLIRLLQEKSATNKTLALENWRLTQRVRVLPISDLA